MLLIIISASSIVSLMSLTTNSNRLYFKSRTKKLLWIKVENKPNLQ